MYSSIYIHTYIHTYIYIYVIICVIICVHHYIPMISPEGLVFFHQFLQEWMEFHVMHGNMAESPWNCPVLVEILGKMATYHLVI